MNFLSHYFFDLHQQDSYQVLGAVLPDLTKNANKSWNIYPHKHESVYQHDAAHASLVNGWKKHLQVDAIFHSSDFFIQQTTKLKAQILPILNNSIVRPSFLAHIALELMLDHLLIAKNRIAVNNFYAHLEAVSMDKVTGFLLAEGISDTDHFVKFYQSFINSKYLLSYLDLTQVSYALKRICMRIWPDPFTAKFEHALADQLQLYKADLEVDFMLIFEQIDPLVNKHA